jgi:hypothetical protein
MQSGVPHFQTNLGGLLRFELDDDDDEDEEEEGEEDGYDDQYD